MADQIKELSNGTYFIGALTNGVAIASTDATTRNVVKDIQVQNNQLTALGAALNFNVNNVTVASLSSSVSGSEIIDVSSTAVAVTPSLSFTNDIIGFFGSTSGTGGKASTISTRKVNGFDASSVVTQSAAIATALSQTNYIAGQWFIGSDFFYLYDEGNSVQTLYRRVGGINGTENIVFNDSYCTIVFNGVDRFHQVNGANIFTYVPATNTTTSVSIKAGAAWATTMSSYPRIAYANGLVFWCNSAGTSVWAINPTTGYNANISSAINIASSSTYTPLAVYFSGGTYYFLSVNNSYSAGYIYIRSAADFGALTSASVYPVTSSAIYNTPTPQITNNVSPQAIWPLLNRNNGDWFWYKSQSSNILTFGCFNMLTQTIKTDLVINTNLYPPAIGSYQNFVFTSSSSANDVANKLNTTFYPQTATLRVTAVQTTP